jgi:hypothetical protein
LASFQQDRFVYQHDSSSLPHGEDLAGLFLASNVDRPFLVLYHLVFVIVTQLPAALPVPTVASVADRTVTAAATGLVKSDTLPQRDSPSTSTLPTLRVVEG